MVTTEIDNELFIPVSIERVKNRKKYHAYHKAYSTYSNSGFYKIFESDISKGHHEGKHKYRKYLESCFSKAAAKLFISQPTLSMAIQKTEASIGMPLFDRSTRPMRLTPAGEIYIDAIKKTLDLEQDLSQQLEDIRSLKTGTISLGGTNYINSYILPDILFGFNQEYPELKISLKSANYITEEDSGK
ncbi:LysR family transcriptional regulator [Oribacterium sp. WCC10]|uniref:LysR family transcriptional regulator n=1 Tax=Oribacterium sp. WCC10 TaxID=1855343 RepID=UPI0008E48392|nr:LysR family transcriptional regulator [Oribacterium sp. WCC10]SFG45059.1 regulatory helix-turn-helix protein, lysR family [Oribacterium sp. WCC10]